VYRLLALYIWLCVHRPFEYWEILGTIRLEFISALAMIGAWVGHNAKSWIRNPLNASYIAFTLTLLFAWFASPYFAEGMQPVQDWFRILVVWAVIVSTIRGERRLRWLVVVFLTATGIYLTHSLREFLNGRYEYRMGIVRMVGVDLANANPNALSGTIIYAVPLTFPFWAEFSKLRRRDKYLLLYYTGLSVLCVVLTGSRSGFIELCCLGISRIWSTRYRVGMLLFLALAAPVGWMMLPPSLANRFMTIVDPSVGPENAQESAEMREKYFQIGMELFKDQPMTGYGPGSFPLASRTGYSPHNLYAQILSELGLPGTLAFLAIICGFVANHLAIRRIARNLPPGQADFPCRLSGAIMIALVLMFIQGMAGHNLFRPHWVWYGAFQAIALDVVRRAGEKPPENTSDGVAKETAVVATRGAEAGI
jgi:O-antigen ligase